MVVARGADASLWAMTADEGVCRSHNMASSSRPPGVGALTDADAPTGNLERVAIETLCLGGPPTGRDVFISEAE